MVTSGACRQIIDSLEVTCKLSGQRLARETCSTAINQTVCGGHHQPQSSLNGAALVSHPVGVDYNDWCRWPGQFRRMHYGDCQLGKWMWIRSPLRNDLQLLGFFGQCCPNGDKGIRGGLSSSIITLNVTSPLPARGWRLLLIPERSPMTRKTDLRTSPERASLRPMPCEPMCLTYTAADSG